jgi:predicted glutamine amidotransferase
MCGLVGIVVKAKNGFTVDQENVFWQMLFADTLRGEDSTGIVAVENDSGFGYIKEAYDASWCVPQMKIHDVTKGMFHRGKALIGHNRKATVGRIEAETAHPFVVDSTFAMVHNGTLRNHRLLHDTVVDSEALAKHLHTIFQDDVPKETLEDEMGKVEGAYAVVAYNQVNHKVYITRNNERPLTIIETPDCWVWASESLLAGWILSRNRYDLTKCKVMELKPDVLVTIDLDTNLLVEEEYTPKKPTPPIITTKMGTGVITSVKKTSKNEFKRLKKEALGRRASFWVDDFVEEDFPNTLAKGSSVVNLLGSLDGLLFEDFQTNVNACINIKEHNIAPEEITDRFYTGIIEDMAYSPVNGHITVMMDYVRVLPRSIVKQDGKWTSLTKPTEQGTYENQTLLH